jgi:hypothetical protein
MLDDNIFFHVDTTEVHIVFSHDLVLSFSWRFYSLKQVWRGHVALLILKRVNLLITNTERFVEHKANLPQAQFLLSDASGVFNNLGQLQFMWFILFCPCISLL